MLTHRGSNPDSSEPKSDVLPITPWVNRRLIRRCKNKYFYGFSGLLRLVKDKRTINEGMNYLTQLILVLIPLLIIPLY